MGTNFIFGEISYMTFACAAILQLAVSMDYSIFLLHRFELERQTESDPGKAMAKAAAASFSSIMASGTTTIVGFIALIFMSYTIGADMGLVLAKGIVFSLLTVMILLPAITVGFTKAIDKTKHKRLLPNMKKVQQLLNGKAKYVVIALLVIVSVVCFMAQNNNTYLYSTNNVGDEKQNTINEKIKQEFGESNEFVILVPKGNEVSEYGMAQELESLPYVRSVQGLYSFIDPTVPDSIVPESVKDELISEHYSRYIVDVNAAVETQKAFNAVTEIRQISSKWFEGSYVTGASPVIFDIQNATSGDFSLVTWLSILFVGIIILVTFRSITLPVILMFIIETSIWINMSVPYFSGEPMIFIGYMVISSVQLGATLDYAILMTNYYLEGRKTLGKKEASEYAAEKAGMSIVMSALVLSSAGFVVSATFNQQAMSQLGALIGRGALLSGFLTIFVLPQVLILLDKLIIKTSFLKSLKSLKERMKNNA
jgi:predicted RND superfamily exporter protein